MKNFIYLGISGIGLALILTGAQATANDGSIVSETHTTAFHTLSKMSMGGPMGPISMTDEQLNAIEGKQDLRQEILTSTQGIVNQGLSQPQQLGGGERLAQEITISTQEIINQNLTN